LNFFFDVIGVGTWDGLWVQAHNRYINKVIFEMVFNSPNNVFVIGALGFSVLVIVMLQVPKVLAINVPHIYVYLCGTLIIKL
jgi:hypothetical protein